MGKVICIRTGRKWRGPKPSQVAALNLRLSEAEGQRRGGNGFEPVGLVAERIVRRLNVR